MKTLPASAVVLCGGASTRMGRDKASLPFGRESLLARTVRLVRSEADDVILAGAIDPGVMGQAVPPNVRVVPDAEEGRGPLPALLGALAHVASARAFVVACDTPLLQPAVVRLLLDSLADQDACVPRVSGVAMTLCAVYRVAPVLAAAASQPDGQLHSLRALLGLLRTRYLDEDRLRRADPRLLTFMPCNTPLEYRAALAMAGLDVNAVSPSAV